MTRLILVGGCSGSGKTLFSSRLAEGLPGPCRIVSTDSYYRDLSGLSAEARETVDFDDAGACDRALLERQLRALKSGKAVRVPRYDFLTHTRRNAGVVVAPADWILLEGIFALHFAEVRRLADMKILLKSPLAVCLERRTRRDTEERGRDADEVAWRFREHVLPNYLKVADALEKVADLVLDARGPVDAIAGLALRRLAG